MLARFSEALPAPLRRWMRILIAAGRNWSASRAATQAAGLSFYTLFSLAPIMIVVVTMVGLVLGERAAHGELTEQLQAVLGTEAAGVINTAVVNSRIDHSGIWPTLLGVCAIIIGATTVFAQMQQSLNRIWQVVPRPSRSAIPSSYCASAAPWAAARSSHSVALRSSLGTPSPVAYMSANSCSAAGSPLSGDSRSSAN